MRIPSLVVAMAIVAGVTGCAPASGGPLAGVSFYVNPYSSAAVAAAAEPAGEERDAFQLLADTPSAIWLLPEVYPSPAVTGYVRTIEMDARTSGTVPVFVVYGIPSRDCGNFSAGGTTAAAYSDWIAAIAEGIADARTVIILEPDSLALAPECGTVDAATAFLRDAVTRLAETSALVYLDGGHSRWLPATEMAPLLEAAGVADARGFATNVSNYNTTDEERAYGAELSDLLDGAHFVIDTSRNGNGSTGEWCNPPGRALGDTPSGVSDSGALDATLWIKSPGESDGTCNGGPAAGRWWPQAALDLVRGT